LWLLQLLLIGIVIITISINSYSINRYWDLARNSRDRSWHVICCTLCLFMQKGSKHTAIEKQGKGPCMNWHGPISNGSAITIKGLQRKRASDLLLIPSRWLDGKLSFALCFRAWHSYTITTKSQKSHQIIQNHYKIIQNHTKSYKLIAKLLQNHTNSLQNHCKIIAKSYKIITFTGTCSHQRLCALHRILVWRSSCFNVAGTQTDAHTFIETHMCACWWIPMDSYGFHRNP
jgi:hypothetical protein